MKRTHQILFGSAIIALTQLAQAQSAAEAVGMPPDAETTPYTSEGMSGTSGSDVTSGESAASGGGDTVTVISGPFAVGPTDPFVQRREAKAQARQEYRERKEAARREYQEDKREANTEFREAIQ